MGNDDKTIRSKINNLTVLCENLWPILYFLGGPLVAPCWLSAQAVQECIENQLKNSYVKFVAEVHVMDRSATSDQMSLPINDLP